MSDSIISSIIMAGATIVSAIILGIVAKIISSNLSKLKKANQLLAEDWEFFYKVEEKLLSEIKSFGTTSIHSKKIEIRKQVSEQMGRKLHIEGPSQLHKYHD